MQGDKFKSKSEMLCIKRSNTECNYSSPTSDVDCVSTIPYIAENTNAVNNNIIDSCSNSIKVLNHTDLHSSLDDSRLCSGIEATETENVSGIPLCNDTPSLASIGKDGESALVAHYRQSSGKDNDCDQSMLIEDVNDGGNKSPSLSYSSPVIVDCNHSSATSNSKTVESKSSTVKRSDSMSSWRKIKAALVWTPFIQQYARHRYLWIQIAGHQGNFKPGEQGTILKKHSGHESFCLRVMSDCSLTDFVPRFKGDVEFEGEKYICMQDLLEQFNMPSLMDIKMGVRTYLEDELIKAQCCPEPRRDMYDKMMEIDKNEPTEEEHKLRAVIKPRYMQWRETLSSTLTLGFRIEGIKKNVGTQSRNFKRTKDRQEVKDSLMDFIDNKVDLARRFIQRLESLKTHLEKSIFFWEHEFIGSSLLFVHDRNGRSNIWMIDFGKTVPLPPLCKVDHISPWTIGNHEDGYLLGLTNLLIMLTEIHSDLSNEQS